MKAIVLDDYGPPSDMILSEIDRPECGDRQVVIRVHAAGVNPIDCRIRSGSLRWILPVRFPLVPGFDVSGVIDEVGAEAREQGWQVGDEVFCFLDNRQGGGYAQYAAASADVVARKPDRISFEEAAAVPLAASTALQALRDICGIAEGHRVLVNGASGGVGTFAVQIATALGARVTGVCGESNLSLARGLGAERVIDYAREDFTQAEREYDVILDAVAKSSYGRCRRALKPRGCYITTVPSPASLLLQPATWFLPPRCHNILVRPRGSDLRQLAEMIERGRVRPVVQEVDPLHDAADSHRASEAGHVRGKLVLVAD